VHTFPVITQKLNFEFSINQILLISNAASDIEFITKILQMSSQKDGIAVSSFIRIYSSVKKPKGQTHFLRPVDLRSGQKRPIKCF